jgi:hemerythrin
MVTEYTHIHFDVEEGFLRNSGFTDFKKHQEWHNELKHKLSSVGHKSLLGHNPQEFLEFLKNWWIEHICEKDRIFRDYLFNQA